MDNKSKKSLEFLKRMEAVTKMMINLYLQKSKAEM